MTTNENEHRSARMILGIGLPLAIAAIAVPWFLVLMPDPVASHFDFGGTPNGSTGRAAFVAQFGGLAVVGMVLCVVTALFSRRLPRVVGFFAPLLGGFFGGLGSSILAITAITHSGLYEWTDARMSGWWMIPLVGISAVLGVIGARVGAKLPLADMPASASGRPASTNLNLGAGERAVWAATQDASWMLGLSLILIAAGVAFALLANWAFAFLAIGGVGVAALATIHARADFDGLHVRYGFLPWPTTYIAIDRIAKASVLQVRPMDWGGWGYRGSLKLMDQAAVVHRAGPGLRLDLVDGKVFVITVDDPDGAAAVLNAAGKRDVSEVSP